MAAASLVRNLGHRASLITVESAGTMDLQQPAHPEAVAVMAARGIDLSDHRSRAVTVPMLRDADLVIGMAREHVRAAALLDPSCLLRTFTLRDVVRRGVGTGGPGPDLSIREWAQGLSAGRRHEDLLGESVLDDIADPIGGSPADFERTAATIAELTTRLATLLRAAEA